MLIHSIEQLRAVINISKASSYERVYNHLLDAERKFIVPLLGPKLFGELEVYSKTLDPDNTPRQLVHDLGNDYLTPADDIEELYDRLIYKVQQAVANLAFFIGFDVLNAIASDTGFRRIETADQKSLFKYQEDNIRNYYKDTGMNLLDHVLEILEINLPLIQDEYESVFLKEKAFIIPSTKIFHAIVNIKESRLTFLRLKQHMKVIEELQLAPLLGNANMKFINESLELPYDQVPEKVLKILPHLRNVVAWGSSMLLMQESGADLTERGLYFEGTKGGNSMSNVVLPTIEPRVMDLIYRNKNIMETYLGILRRFLAENAEEWDIEENPRRYVHQRDNTGKKNFWA